MCCVAILAAILLATSLPQHEAVTDKRVSHNILVKEANAVAKFNNGNFCLPRDHWKRFQENKVIRYNQSNCTKAELLTCHCVSAKLRAGTSTEIDYYFGHCLYGCFMNNFSQYYDISTESALKGEKCALFHRTGLLCGKCEQGYGVPSYSFNIHCVPCHNVTLWKNILHYIAIAYGPLTVFLMFIVVFTVSVIFQKAQFSISMVSVLTQHLSMASFLCVRC